MQDIETKDNPRLKPTVARVKWLEPSSKSVLFNMSSSSNLAHSLDCIDNTGKSIAEDHYYRALKSGDKTYNYSNNIKHLSLLDRLKRMFKR